MKSVQLLHRFLPKAIRNFHEALLTRHRSSFWANIPRTVAPPMHQIKAAIPSAAPPENRTSGRKTCEGNKNIAADRTIFTVKIRTPGDEKNHNGHGHVCTAAYVTQRNRTNFHDEARFTAKINNNNNNDDCNNDGGQTKKEFCCGRIFRYLFMGDYVKIPFYLRHYSIFKCLIIHTNMSGLSRVSLSGRREQRWRRLSRTTETDTISFMIN
jgi:hypothetical protein